LSKKYNPNHLLHKLSAVFILLLMSACSGVNDLIVRDKYVDIKNSTVQAKENLEIPVHLVTYERRYAFSLAGGWPGYIARKAADLPAGPEWKTFWAYSLLLPPPFLWSIPMGVVAGSIPNEIDEIAEVRMIQTSLNKEIALTDESNLSEKLFIRTNAVKKRQIFFLIRRCNVDNFPYHVNESSSYDLVYRVKIPVVKITAMTAIDGKPIKLSEFWGTYMPKRHRKISETSALLDSDIELEMTCASGIAEQINLVLNDFNGIKDKK